MVDYSNPFLTSFLGSRNQFTQPQNQFMQPQNQYDFSGWGDRLNKIEEGIAGLTKQFNNFQTPGDVAPEYTGNAAPEPLPDIKDVMPEGLPEGSNEMFGQRPGIINPGNINPDYSTPINSLTANAPEPRPGLSINSTKNIGIPLIPTSKMKSKRFPEPLGGIESLAPTQNTGFNFDPSGGSLFSQLSTAYGQPATMQDQFNQDNPNYVSQAVSMGHAEPGTPHYIRGGGDYTQGFQDFVHDQGYYVDPRGSYADGPMRISETPIDLPFKGPRQENISLTDTGWGPQQLQNQNAHQPFQTFANPSGGKMAGSDLQSLLNSAIDPSKARGAGGELLSGYVGHPIHSAIKAWNERPNDMAMPIGGLTQPQQQQALQGGLGALQGPTQQKIQQGLGSLGAGI